MALAASRAPDIIDRQSIPLSATSDQPVGDLPQPPLSASSDPTDQANGISKEISAAELAAAAAARRGDPATSDLGEDGKPKAAKAEPDDAGEVDEDGKPKQRIQKAKVPFDPNDPLLDDIPKDTPDWYRREVASIRRTERSKTEAAFAAAKAQMGDAAWDAALEATRDKVVGEAKAEAARALKTAKEAQEAIVSRDAELAELRAKVPAVVEDKPAEDPRPTRDQFDDPDEYDNALTSWGEREGERKIAARVAAERAEETRLAEEKAQQEAREAQAVEVAKVKEGWDTKVEDAKTRYDDFEAVVTKKHEDGGPLVTDAMTAGIMMLDNGPDVAYHLGLNLEESRRIAALNTPARQLLEIGRLGERLANPARRARPPAPIQPIDNTGNTADASDAEPSMEEYAARRLPQLQAGRRPFYPPSNVH